VRLKGAAVSGEMEGNGSSIDTELKYNEVPSGRRKKESRTKNLAGRTDHRLSGTKERRGKRGKGSINKGTGGKEYKKGGDQDDAVRKAWNLQIVHVKRIGKG